MSQLRMLNGFLKVAQISKQQNDGSYEVNMDLLRRVIGKTKERVMFIMLYGSYGMGKTTLIRYLTRKNIQAYTRSYEPTLGVYIYGPYHYNDIRKLFGFRKVEQKQDIIVYFIDTEGMNNPKMLSSQSDYRMTKLLAPFIGISNIVISLIKPNVTQEEIESMSYMFNFIQKTKESLKIIFSIGIVTNVTGNFDTYKNICETQGRVTFIMSGKKNLSMFDIFVPLPPPEHFCFENGLKYLVKEIFIAIDDFYKKDYLTGEGAYKVFKEMWEDDSFIEPNDLAKNTRVKWQSDNLIELFLPLASGKIDEARRQIENMYKTFEYELMKLGILKPIEFNAKEIYRPLLKNLKANIPESFKKLPNYHDFKRRIKNEITVECNKYNDAIIKELKPIQINYLLATIGIIYSSEEFEIINKITNEIMKTGQKEAPISNIRNYINLLYDHCVKEVDKVCEIYNIYRSSRQDAIMELNDKIIDTMKVLQKIVDEAFLESQERHKKGRYEYMNYIALLLRPIFFSFVSGIGEAIGGKVIDSIAEHFLGIIF